MNDQQQSTAESGTSSKSSDNENDNNTNAESSSKISDSELFPGDDSGSEYIGSTSKSHRMKIPFPYKSVSKN
jgi:hypothetical protein